MIFDGQLNQVNNEYQFKILWPMILHKIHKYIDPSTRIILENVCWPCYTAYILFQYRYTLFSHGNVYSITNWRLVRSSYTILNTSHINTDSTSRQFQYMHLFPLFYFYEFNCGWNEIFKRSVTMVIIYWSPWWTAVSRLTGF